MLAQLALEEQDVASAVEKLGRSLQIKKNLFTDPDNLEIQRTVAQLNDLYNKLKKNEVFETPIDQVPTQRPKQFSFNQGFNQSFNQADEPISPGESEKPSVYRPRRISEETSKGEFGSQGKYGANQFMNRQMSGPMSNQGAVGKTEPRTSLQGPDNTLLRGRSDSGSGGRKPPAFGGNPNNESINKFLAAQKGKAISEETESEDLEDEIADQMKKKAEASDDSSSDEEIKQIEVRGKEQLKKRLDPIQLIKFDMLKDDVFHRSIEPNFDPLQTILASDFYKSLTPKSKEKFHELNGHIIKI